MILGIISDTHSLLRPEAVNALTDSDLILHGGDIGKPEVLEVLKSIAPVRAVRGNNDIGPWADNIPDCEIITVGSVKIYMIHDVKELSIDPAAEGYRIVVSGHSHKPSIQERDGVLYLNPGSAGPRRFKLPVCVARLEIKGKKISSKLIELQI